MKILDSGNRREFDTGAVRDMAEEKGRCDLLPLIIISEYLSIPELYFIEHFIRTGDTVALHKAITRFVNHTYGKKETAVLELAKHYEAGAKKYEERNWEKGIPLHVYIDSGVRHLIKYYRGDTDEPHNRAFLWNMFCAIWTVQNKPELCDLPYNDKTGDTTLTPDCNHDCSINARCVECSQYKETEHDNRTTDYQPRNT